MPRRIEKYREMRPGELQAQERELAEQIFRLRFQIAGGQAEGLKKLREARRDLARVKTLLRQLEISAASGKGK
jgi:large subunit ribosomal protein L29